MNINSATVINAATLALFMVSFAQRLLRDFRQSADAESSVQGWFLRIESCVSPAASKPNNRETGKRSPRIQGSPPQTAGLVVIR